ncbi:hypothetical protein [Dechloromonas sp. A34]|uniref:hypothetical protein n=1 Tax=Dechloromonas sp. A34 TaxID=447588 RepID=UPI002248959D|nr:hypothetical protein [Dechloromonas sp. A34]
MLDQHAGSALIAFGGLAIVWISWKLWQKYRFRQLSAVPHITPGELLAAMESEQPRSCSTCAARA